MIPKKPSSGGLQISLTQLPTACGLQGCGSPSSGPVVLHGKVSRIGFRAEQRRCSKPLRTKPVVCHRLLTQSGWAGATRKQQTIGRHEQSTRPQLEALKHVEALKRILESKISKRVKAYCAGSLAAQGQMKLCPPSNTRAHLRAVQQRRRQQVMTGPASEQTP